MTIIAFDGKSIAADTRYSLKNSFYGYTHKILPLHKGGVVATAGTMGGGAILRDALNAGKDILKVLNKKEINALDSFWIDQNGDCHYLDGVASRYLPVEDKVCAIGTGQDIAMAFLRQGFNAEDACKVVSKALLDCNDLIDVYDIKKRSFKLVNFPR